MVRFLPSCVLVVYLGYLSALPVLSPATLVNPPGLHVLSIAFGWRFAWCIGTNCFWGALFVLSLYRTEQCTWNWQWEDSLVGKAALPVQRMLTPARRRMMRTALLILTLGTLLVCLVPVTVSLLGVIQGLLAWTDRVQDEWMQWLGWRKTRTWKPAEKRKKRRNTSKPAGRIGGTGKRYG